MFETDYTESLREYRNKAEKMYIEGLIERYPKDMNKVAEILSISRRQLFNKLVEFGLKLYRAYGVREQSIIDIVLCFFMQFYQCCINRKNLFIIVLR